MKLRYSERAERAFRLRYKGAGNFMTPQNVARGLVHGGTLAVEISKGRGIFTNEIFGVTVLLVDDPMADVPDGVNQCLSSLAEAEAYAERLDREGIPSNQEAE